MAALALLFAAVTPRYATGAKESPRLRSLAAAMAADRPGALEAFRAERVREGPLVEPIESDSTHVLLTFLWFADRPVTRVVQESVLEGRDVTRRALHPVGGGNELWARTYVVPAGLRLSYLMSPDDRRLASDGSPTADDGDPARWVVDPLARRVERGEDNRDWAVLELPGSSRPPGSGDPVEAEPQPRTLTLPAGVLGRAVTLRAYRFGEPGRQPAPLLIFFDAAGFIDVDRAPRMLAAMVRDGALPPLVAAFVPTDGPDRNRDVSCNAATETFLVGELLPKLRAEFRAGVSPEQTVVIGRSRSGLGAVCAALRAPSAIGNAVAQSGAFWWSPPGEETEWLARWIVDHPRAPVRLVLQAGLLESSANPATGLAMLTVSRHLRDVARARGYEVVYSEFAGGHDPAAWRSALPGALVAAIEKPSSSPPAGP
jgi:enterochelin esterase family protein